MKKNCSGCGKKIDIGSYCSEICRNRRTKRRRQLYKSKQNRKKCPKCSRTIVKPRSHAQIYCSDLCMRVARAERKKFRYRDKNNYRVRDVIAFTMWLAKQFYPFLIQYHIEDLRATCALIQIEIEAKGLKMIPAVSRFARHWMSYAGCLMTTHRVGCLTSFVTQSNPPARNEPD